MSLPPAPPVDSMSLVRPPRGGGWALGTAVSMLVLSGVAFLCASTLDLVLFGGFGPGLDGPRAVVATGWVITLAAWVGAIVLVVRRQRRRYRPWVPALWLGVLMGAIQIGSWVLALDLAP